MKSIPFLMLFAPSGQAGGPGIGIFMFQMLAFIAIIYFLMIRPKVKQEREHRERIQALKKGDAVTTAGGIIGEVVHIKDEKVTIKSGDTRLVVLRDRITGVGSEATENKSS